MDNEEKVSSDFPSIRRSTRSTRSSIKPIINQSTEKKEDHEEEVFSPDLSDHKSESNGSDYSPEPIKKRTSRVTTSKKKSSEKTIPASNSTKKQQQQKLSTAKHQKQTESDRDKYVDVDESVVSVDYKLTKEEKRDIDKAFDTYDTECCNFIHRRNLKSALRALGYEPRSDEIQRLTRLYAGSVKDDHISRENFYEMMRTKIGNSANANNRKGLPEEISKVFELFDIDKTGKVTFDNLKAIAKELGEKISDEELHEMIGEADLDGDRQVDESEFLKIMKKTSLY